MNPKKVQKGESLDEWLSRAPENVVPLVQKLIDLLAQHPAGFFQTVKWAHPWYSYNEMEMFSLSWHSAHAGFQLWNGAHIPNPYELIEGTGKNGRNIKIKSLDDKQTWDAVSQAIEDSIHYVENR